MLYRTTLLRRPWEPDLIPHLGEPDEDATAAQATAKRLSRTSLLEQVEYGKGRRYTLHPATVQFVMRRFGEMEALRRETHRRVGEHLEAQAKTSRYIETDIEAGHHLFEAGEYDRAYELLGSASDWLRNHGRVRESLNLVEPFLKPSLLRDMDRGRTGRLLGTVGLAYAALGQVEQAIGYYEQALAIVREIGDRHGEGAVLGNLGAAYYRLGQVEQAIGYYEQRLVIARETGDRRGEGNALGSLGLAYAALGQVEQAIGLLEQTLRIGQENKDVQILRVATAQLQQLRGGGPG
jgi:tetratricopeptide (TPR) repeat protein